MSEYFFPETSYDVKAKDVTVRVRMVNVRDALDPITLSDGVSIAADAFGVSSITSDFETDVLEHLKNHQVAFAYSREGEPLGFASIQLLETAGIGNLYVSGLVIKNKAQQHGIGTSLVVETINAAKAVGFPVDYVSGRTQNPVVAQARMHYCDPVFPVTSPPDERGVQIAQSLHSHLNMIEPLNPTTLVTRNVFPFPLNRDHRPVSKNPTINSFFDMHVGPRDAVFIIGKPKI